MGYLIKAVLGAGLFVGCLVLFNVKLVELLETGTCASGNVPYEIAPGYECPGDTGTNILLLTASIFGMLIGAGIYAFRGRPPWGSRGSEGMFGAGILAWGLFFSATGATSLYSSLTNEAIQESNGGELGGIITGVTFLVMGLPALLFGLWRMIRGLGDRDEHPAAATVPAGGGGMFSRMSAGLEQAKGTQNLGSRPPWGSTAPSTPGGGSGAQIAKLERIQRLRESGALTGSEFEREKAKILAEG
jgi:hypothetical protein